MPRVLALEIIMKVLLFLVIVAGVGADGLSDSSACASYHHPLSDHLRKCYVSPNTIKGTSVDPVRRGRAI